MSRGESLCVPCCVVIDRWIVVSVEHAVSCIARRKNVLPVLCIVCIFNLKLDKFVSSTFARRKERKRHGGKERTRERENAAETICFRQVSLASSRRARRVFGHAFWREKKRRGVGRRETRREKENATEIGDRAECYERVDDYRLTYPRFANHDTR